MVSIAKAKKMVDIKQTAYQSAKAKKKASHDKDKPVKTPVPETKTETKK